MDRLDLMQLFVRVYEAGSFSRAAKELGLTQPTVSKNIAALEEQMGARLFQRTTRVSSPTEAATAFYERCKQILFDFESARAAIRTQRGELTGTLRLSAPSSFAQCCLSGALFEFQRSHPGLTMDLMLDDRFIDLVEEGIDISIRIGNLSDSSLVARRIGTVPLCLVAAPSYLAEHGTPALPEELPRHDWARFYYRPAADTLQLRKDGEVRQIQVTSRTRINNGMVLGGAVRAGLGIALLPVWLVWDDLLSGRVVQIMSEWALPTMPIHAVFPSADRIPARVRACVDACAEALPGVPSLREDWREILATRTAPAAAGAQVSRLK